MQYDKPFKSFDELLVLLNSRGLSTDKNSEHYLRHINYYRLTGYMLPFQPEKGSHQFLSGTHFNDVLNLYIFDRELRLLLLDAIERIEVSLRTQWAHFFAQTHGAHAYVDPELSIKKVLHRKNLSILRENIARSDEVFITHYNGKYTKPCEPPIWAACEVMSIGLLSRWLRILKPRDTQRMIAGTYQLNYNVLVSFTEHLAYIRNLCAHHSRVWNRRFTKTMKLPVTKPSVLTENFNRDEGALRKLHNTLVMVAHIMNIISPKNHFIVRLSDLLDHYSIDPSHMGFPEGWRDKSIWH